ncbi:MAG: ElyC/SanA/YdcF family protein [Faecalibacterium sp.]
MNKSVCDAINTLAAFCGVRDLPQLTKACLVQQYNMEQVDVMVLFGGSILAGGDVFAAGIQQQMAKQYIIVGGAGHTTQALRAQMQVVLPALQTEALSEAALFQLYIKEKYGVQADYLECNSTNCGNNITYLLALLQREGIACSSILLIQDATMQRRMAATLRKVAPDVKIIQFAAYQIAVQLCQGQPMYCSEAPLGMWEIARYRTLLMGEIPRLRDDANGYGPKGSGFIAHEEIPLAVEESFALLQAVYTDGARKANPAYASQ